MRIAACPYQCEALAGWVAHEAKLSGLLTKAAADLVVLPEYAAMEAALMAERPGGTARAWRDRAAARASDWVAQAQHLAAIHRCHVLAGSGPVLTDRGVVNRAWLVAPSGDVAHQDKLILTPYEREEMGLVPGEHLTLFDTVLGRIGVLICYDCEFPMFARQMAEAGADMILVPSCTDLAAGQTRVRQSARARAIENQCLVVQAPLVGAVPGCEIIDQSTGRAGIFAPPDHGLPPDGILAEGPTDSRAPVIWDGDLSTISGARSGGQVGNFRHWPEQMRITSPPKIVPLA